MYQTLVAALALVTILGGFALVRERNGKTNNVFASVVSTVLLAISLVVAFLGTPTQKWQVPAITVLVILAGGLGGAGPVGLTLSHSMHQTSHRQGSLPGSVIIGIVERLTTILALTLGLPEVAALIIGIKALGQYVDNNAASPQPSGNQLAAERVIGTILSLLWALLAYSCLELTKM